MKPKILIKKIVSSKARHITFSKRRKGLFKKAYELSTLCDADIATIVFSRAGNLFEYSSSNVASLIAMRNETSSQVMPQHGIMDRTSKHLKGIKNHLAAKELDEKIKIIRHMSGHDLQDLNVDDLNELEDLISKSLKRVVLKKHQTLKEENSKLKEIIIPREIPQDYFGSYASQQDVNHCYEFL